SPLASGSTRSVATALTAIRSASRATEEFSRVLRGVSAPRYAMRQLRERSASPNAIRPSSCCSPGRHARSASPDAAAPVAAQSEQAPAEHVRREVLLRDRRLVALPALPEVVKIEKDNVCEEDVDGRNREQAGDHGMRRR